MEDIIYVLYYEGKLYKNRNKSIISITESEVKELLISEVKRVAVKECGKTLSWYEMTKDEQDRRINRVESRFEIKEFKSK